MLRRRGLGARSALGVRRTRGAQIAATALAMFIGSADVTRGQLPRDSAVARPRMVVITPGAKYEAGWLHEAILGANYRALWTTPIEVPLLDLRREAGGLTPTERGGSMQTNSLRFKAGDGREYVFRPSEKDFTKGLPPELRETLVRDIAQDQVSGYHPASAVVVGSLLDAVGLHHPRPRLVVMPDDPLLGEFRAEFAGVLGTFEERPDDDFDATEESPGARNVVSSERLFERMRANAAERVDARAYLAARLFDILVGDRDRHRDQWRWGKFSDGAGALWEPIPRDRDMPFARFDGLGPALIRGFVPQLITFGERYPSMVWLNWNAREIDRRLLVGLERSAWDSVTRTLQTQLSDSVIEAAIAAMPPPWARLNRTSLRSALVARRERLPQAAREFYQVLAREVNFSGTDSADVAEVTRHADGSIDVALSGASPRNGVAGDAGDRSQSSRPAHLARRFLPADTREVRLYLHGGNDRVVVRGQGSGGVTLRVIGGAGDDVVVDSVSPSGDVALRVYDAVGADSLTSRGQVVIDRRPYAPPATDRAEREVRDWGTWSFVQRSASVSPGAGLLVGVSHTRHAYGFRYDPFASRSITRIDVSVTERRPRLTWDGTFPRANSRSVVGMSAVASGLELIRFHGIGNETTAERETDFYRVFQNLVRVAPRWSTPLSKRAMLTLDASAQFTSTRDSADNLLSLTRPYGSGDFGQIGVGAGVSVDHRDSPTAPTRGYRVDIHGALVPALWSVDRTFGNASVAASTYLTPNGDRAPTLALRAGGRRIWGTFPFHEASPLGGVSTLRGWDQQRFAGRSSLYGSAEVRAYLAKARVIVPLDVGVLAFQDAGRVWADDERSDRWHYGTGGGIWLAPLMRTYTVSVSVAGGRERVALYLSSGFAF